VPSDEPPACAAQPSSASLYELALPDESAPLSLVALNASALPSEARALPDAWVPPASLQVSPQALQLVSLPVSQLVSLWVLRSTRSDHHLSIPLN
tara:strand:- start:517 stop:801 length:285 start_codon:yes stop_codon:yes gene_type:complete